MFKAFYMNFISDLVILSILFNDLFVSFTNVSYVYNCEYYDI